MQTLPPLPGSSQGVDCKQVLGGGTMSSVSADIGKKVFRLRGLPNTVGTPADAAALVAQGLGLAASSDVTVCSLATTLDYWESPPSKVSTLQFSDPLQSFGTPVRPGEWRIPLSGSDAGRSLILDTHFLGLTPLNDVDESRHVLEYV